MAHKLKVSEKNTIKDASEKFPASAVTSEFRLRIRKQDDGATIILVGHLLVENLLNQIIQSKLKSPQIIIKDSKSYPFSVKLQILYAAHFIPDELFKNITKLNQLRNKFSHNLDYKAGEKDMIIVIDNEEKTFKFSDYTWGFRLYAQQLCHHIIYNLSKNMIDMQVKPINSFKD